MEHWREGQSMNDGTCTSAQDSSRNARRNVIVRKITTETARIQEDCKLTKSDASELC